MPRQRFVYRTNPDTGECESFEVGADFTGAERRAPVATEELTYGGMAAPGDGTPIDSRRKFREYCKEKGVTHASDYSASHWEKSQAQRDAVRSGAADSRARRELIGRALYQQPRRK